MADQLKVNGNVYGYASSVVKIGGDRFYGITEITYGDARERQYAYGMARHHAPIGRSPGKYTVDVCKIKGYTHTIEAIRDALANLSEDGISYGNVESEIVVQYVERGQTPQHHQIERCVVSKDSQGITESPEPGMAELELMPMLIRRNGKTLADSSEESP